MTLPSGAVISPVNVSVAGRDADPAATPLAIAAGMC
jgi:hypothetical protein